MIEAGDGQEAMGLLQDPQQEKPDVILCGMEFVHTLRRAKNQTPVLILTGEKDKFLREVTEQAGATKILSKPISGPDLKNEIYRAMGFAVGD